jgi:phosphoglycolate phosphatase-like HAD superfamily hydrolase
MAPTVTRLLDASAIIFDVDGTLVDTVDFHAEAWQKAFAAFGHMVEFQAIRSQIGKGGDQLMPVFLPPDVLGSQGKAIEAWRKDLFARDYMPRVRGFPEVPDLFRFLLDAGVRVALGSSAKADELEAYKKAAGIEGLAEVETTADDAERSKPHPDIFQAVLDRLGLAPSRVMVVGDTPYDVEAASKAGMATVALLCGGFPEPDLRGAGAVGVRRDPADLLKSLRQSRTS